MKRYKRFFSEALNHTEQQKIKQEIDKALMRMKSADYSDKDYFTGYTAFLKDHLTNKISSGEVADMSELNSRDDSSKEDGQIDAAKFILNVKRGLV